MTATTPGWPKRARGKMRRWRLRATYRRADVAQPSGIRDTYILRFALAVSDRAALLSPINWLFGTRDWIENLPPAEAASARSRRAKAIDGIILGSLVTMSLAAVTFALPLPAWVRLCIAGLVVLRLADVLQAVVAMSLFDPIRAPGRPLSNTSIARVFVNSGANFVEIWLGFSIISMLFSDAYEPTISGPLDGLFHGFTTQVALGSPFTAQTPAAQGVTMAHMAVTFVFVVLVLGRWLTALTASGDSSR